jgi:hypothetical protein
MKATLIDNFCLINFLFLKFSYSVVVKVWCSGEGIHSRWDCKLVKLSEKAI